jgi:Tfp pilus assembly protein PilN
MIRINLLESVTDRPSGVAMVEARVANPGVQTFFLALTVGGLLFLGASYDYVSSRSAHAAAQRELQNQQQIAQQMILVNKEQIELEGKTRDIQVRIDAIQRLKTSQQGPSAVLREIKDRFDNVPGLYLKSIEQKEGEVTIKGESPNESSVTRFGQSLEFSSGLFTNLNIETQKDAVQARASSTNSAADEASLAKPEVVSFIVKCNYSQRKDNPQATTPNATSPNQVAMKK